MEWLDTFWSTYSTLVLHGRHQYFAGVVDLFDLVLRLADASPMPHSWASAPIRAALLTFHADAPFLLALSCGALLPALVALVIGQPTLRLSGVYLAMATLAFGEVVRIVILNSEATTGGALGLNGIPQRASGFDVALAVVLALYVLLRLARSRVGRTMTAISQDEIATELMGLNVRAYKLFVFRFRRSARRSGRARSTPI